MADEPAKTDAEKRAEAQEQRIAALEKRLGLNQPVKTRDQVLRERKRQS